MRKSHFNDEFLVLLGPIISRFFHVRMSKKINKNNKGCVLWFYLYDYNTDTWSGIGASDRRRTQWWTANGRQSGRQPRKNNRSIICFEDVSIPGSGRGSYQVCDVGGDADEDEGPPESCRDFSGNVSRSLATALWCSKCLAGILKMTCSHSWGEHDLSWMSYFNATTFNIKTLSI